MNGHSAAKIAIHSKPFASVLSWGVSARPTAKKATATTAQIVAINSKILLPFSSAAVSPVLKQEFHHVGVNTMAASHFCVNARLTLAAGSPRIIFAHNS